MSILIDNLSKLNRKERFFLIGTALGNPEFKLDRLFRQKLSDEFGVAVPNTAYVAMDYHLNWIFAAVADAFRNPVRDHMHENKCKMIDGTQEDVDLLVAFENDLNLYHLIMLEAKAFTPFSNSQFKHKADRLRKMFGEGGEEFPQVKPHFGLMSPRPPEKLHLDACPPWFRVGNRIHWVEMKVPDERLILSGCDERGKPNQQRRYWKIRQGQCRNLSN